jgi:FkbM family methyltransferase
MISYAFNHEDVLLRRAFGEQRTGFYIDIGAHHPTDDSVTKHFSDRGWRGINVEPIPGRASDFAAQRPHDVNLSVGVSDTSGAMAFYEVVDAATLSTFSKELACEYEGRGYNVRRRQVQVLTLAQVCEHHVTHPIDFLSIDVEGHERQVLKGADFGRWRPRLVIVESTRPGSSVPTHAGWEHLLLDADYLFATFDGINRYYVRSEERELVSRLVVPVNALDDFIPYRQYLLETELTRYRRLNPLRRVAVWFADMRRALPHKLARHRAPRPNGFPARTRAIGR